VSVLPIDFGRLRPRAARQAVVPVFLPFRGCPVRCVFCAQDVQTGLGGASASRGEPGRDGAGGLLRAARHGLRLRHEQGQAPAELAFYGGTFTALPERELADCLDLAREALEQGWIGLVPVFDQA